MNSALFVKNESFFYNSIRKLVLIRTNCGDDAKDEKMANCRNHKHVSDWNFYSNE